MYVAQVPSVTQIIINSKQLISLGVYSTLVQGTNAKLVRQKVYCILIHVDHLAQANYFRDPMAITRYLEHGAYLPISFFWVLSFLVAQFLPDINNEKIHKFNATYRNNFASLDSLILVKAKRDTQVFPSESEWFGVYADVDAFKRILKYNETTWYQQDLFGLKELDRAGKIHFHETDGDHLVISDQTIIQLVRKHFRESPYFQSDSASAA